MWSAGGGCYEFLARHCAPGARTLETGLGVSTVLFAMWGTEHICVVRSEDEVRRWREHCQSRGIGGDSVRFELGRSHDALPRLQVEPLDLVFVDGSHGFPAPIIDWFYAGEHLRRNGVIVFDDTHLPHVRLGLFEFLEKDPRWTRLESTGRWAAYRKDRVGPLSEDWTEQPFLGRPSSPT